MSLKPNIDFHIHSDPYWLRVADYSIWSLIEDKPSIIEITLPGYSTKVIEYFDKYKTNGFNSLTLKINCDGDCGDTEKVTLPDGIYEITVKGSPDKFNKTYHYLKTDMLQLDLDKVIIEAFEEGCINDISNKLTEIELLLEGARSYIRYDNLQIAGNMYQKASGLVEKLKDCKTCD